MKPFVRSFAGVGALAATILGAPCALAEPTFDDRDLRGEYVFAGMEQRRALPGAAPAHCAFAGTASFDGKGTAILNVTQRCVLGANAVTESLVGEQYYSVNPDGSFLMSEQRDLSDPVHGQIVDHGRTLLLDGTLRTSIDIVNWLATAMRR